MWVMPSPTASRSTATAASRSAGGPNTCGPANCIAPYPIRVTVRSSARVNVPPGSVFAAIRTRLSRLPRSVAGDSAGLAEVGAGPRQPDSVDVKVDLLVGEGDQSGDGLHLAGWEVVGPREILVALTHLVTDAYRPVSAGHTLVWACRLGAGRHEVLEGDVGPIEVIAGRQARLEQ